MYFHNQILTLEWSQHQFLITSLSLSTTEHTQKNNNQHLTFSVQTCDWIKQPYLFARCRWVLCWWLFASGHPKAQKRAELLWRGWQEPLLKCPLFLPPRWPAPWLQPGQIDPHGSSPAKQTRRIHTLSRRCMHKKMRHRGKCACYCPSHSSVRGSSRKG